MKGNPIILYLECITRALTLWRVDLLALFQKSQHHSGSLVSLVCLMPVITIGVFILFCSPVVFKNKSILFFCPPRAPWALCKMLAMLGWSSLSHTCLLYCWVSSLAPCAQSCLQCGKYPSVGRLRAEHRDDSCQLVCGCTTARHCSPVLHVALLVNTNKYKKCLLTVKFLSLDAIDFIDCVLCQWHRGGFYTLLRELWVSIAFSIRRVRSIQKP